ncbi:hypothetical protein AKJ16_DCAP10703 [Drosera capensis]
MDGHNALITEEQETGVGQNPIYNTNSLTRIQSKKSERFLILDQQTKHNRRPDCVDFWNYREIREIYSQIQRTCKGLVHFHSRLLRSLRFEFSPISSTDPWIRIAIFSGDFHLNIHYFCVSPSSCSSCKE